MNKLSKIFTLLMMLIAIVISSKAKASGCHAAFSYKITGKTITLMDSSSAPIHYWFFGDGSYDTTKNASHTYAKSGTYKVKLIIHDKAAGCYDSTYQYIIIASACKANYTYSTTGLNASFTNSSAKYPGTRHGYYYWFFGDGNKDTGLNANHKYSKTGSYTVCLKAFDYDSSFKRLCSDSECKTVVVSTTSTCNITADYSYTTSGLSVSFTNKSSSKGRTVIYGYSWGFGDSTGSTTKSPTHTFKTAGKYRVIMYAYDSGKMCYDYKIDTIIVSNSVSTCGLHAKFNYKVSGDTVTFTDSSYSTGKPIAMHYWVFGDSSKSVTTKNATHVYKHGSYTVTLYVLDSINSTKCYSTYKENITIGGGGSTTCSIKADFSYTITGLSVSFTNTSSSKGSSSIYGYGWGFGDSSGSSTKSPSHTYKTAGKYRVVMYAYDSAKKCYDSKVDTIILHSGSTPCDVSISYAVAGFKLYVSASAKTGSSVTKFYWQFRDGTYSVNMKDTHTYTKTGTYWVKYTAYNTTGCLHSDSFKITIHGTYDLDGKVYLSGGNDADNATVYLIYYNTSDSTLNLVDSTTISAGDSGIYHFGGVKAGKYLVKAALRSGSTYYSNYLPTYHDSSLRWDSATYVYVSMHSYADIHMIPGTNHGGPGFIGGKVAVGANKKGDPIPNVPILLYTASHIPVGYTYSDANGIFGLSSLAYGSYIVYPEVLGKNTTPAYITISAANASVNNLDVEVGTKSVVAAITGIEDAINEQGSVRLFPNPVREMLTLAITNTKNRSIIMQVLDATGRIMITENSKLAVGTQQIQIDTKHLPGGIYFVSIRESNGNFEQHYRFIKAD